MVPLADVFVTVFLLYFPVPKPDNFIVYAHGYSLSIFNKILQGFISKWLKFFSFFKFIKTLIALFNE